MNPYKCCANCHYGEMKEEWKTCTVANRFEVSNHGRVRTKAKGRILKGSKRDGYVTFNLQTKHGQKHMFGHRLVTFTFLPKDNNEDRKFVNHLDGNKANNHLPNLQWVTQGENSKHAVRTGLCGSRHVPVLQISMEDKKTVMKEYGSVTEAAKAMGALSQKGSITNVCRGITQSAFGFHWQYKFKAKQMEYATDLEGEVWKPYETKREKNLEVSNYGRMRNTSKHCMVNLCFRANGYVSAGGTLLHIAVAKLFVKNPDPEHKTVVNHKDHDKRNNHFSNLEWMTTQENVQHGCNKPVNQLDKEGNFIKRWNSATEAAKALNILACNISICIKRKSKTAGGSRWEHAAREPTTTTMTTTEITTTTTTTTTTITTTKR